MYVCTLYVCMYVTLYVDLPYVCTLYVMLCVSIFCALFVVLVSVFTSFFFHHAAFLFGIFPIFRFFDFSGILDFG